MRHTAEHKGRIERRSCTATAGWVYICVRVYYTGGRSMAGTQAEQPFSLHIFLAYIQFIAPC